MRRNLEKVLRVKNAENQKLMVLSLIKSHVYWQTFKHKVVWGKIFNRTNSGSIVSNVKKARLFNSWKKPINRKIDAKSLIKNLMSHL